MNRRHFLHISTGLLTISHPLSGFCRAEAVNIAALAEPGLLSFLGDGDYIRALGNSYLQQFPDESRISTLLTNLTTRSVADDTTDNHHWQTQIKRRIEHDFATGNTVLVNGWMLSRTEAQQTALYSMLYS